MLLRLVMVAELTRDATGYRSPEAVSQHRRVVE
jgi:hypothetical protein